MPKKTLDIMSKLTKEERNLLIHCFVLGGVNRLVKRRLEGDDPDALRTYDLIDSICRKIGINAQNIDTILMGITLNSVGVEREMRDEEGETK